MNHWLIKSEPDCYSIGDLAKDKVAAWTGIRNYQARNFMRDGMKVGDRVIFYHSSADPAAAVGTATVASAPHADLTALDKKDDHYDPKATKDNPIWMCVDMKYASTFGRVVPIGEIRLDPKLSGIPLTLPGQRLSVMPISKAHYERIVEIGGKA